MIEPLKIFCCCTREDQGYFSKLKKQLAPLKNQRHIVIRSDMDFQAGDEREKALQQELSQADIILLLISADFMDSDYYYTTQMQQAIAHREKETVRVIPILVHPTILEGAPFAKLEMLPKNGKPITDGSWHNENFALYEVAKEISIVTIDLRIKQLEGEADKQRKRLQSFEEGHAKAIELYEAIIQLKPDYAAAYDKMSIVFFKIKKPEQALQAYKKALELDTTFTNYNRQGRILSHLGRYQESLQAFEQELAYHPEAESEICALKADIYFHLNDPAKELEMYQRLTQIRPNYHKYFDKAGALLIQGHVYEQAQAMYKRAIELEPKVREYHEALGKIYYKLGRHAEALASYQKAIEIENSNPDEYYIIAQLHLILRQYQEAIDTFTSCIKAGNNNPSLYYYRSQALQVVERYEEALEDIHKAIALSASDVDPRFLENKRQILELLAKEADKQAKQARIEWIKRERFSFIPESVTLLKEFVAHTGDVNCLAITPDGRRLFSGSSKGGFKEWEPGIEEAGYELGGHSHAILNLSISADGKIMVSSSFKGSIKVWDLRTMQWELLTKSMQGIYKAAISHDGTIIASSDSDFSIKGWDRASKQVSSTIFSISLAPAITLFSLDDQNLLIGHSTGIIEKIALTTERSHFRRQVHKGQVRCMTMSADNKMVISGGDDHIIYAWDLETRKRLEVMDKHSGVINSVAVHPDGTLLASSSADGTIRYWNLKTGALLHTIDCLGYAISLVFNPTNGVLYAGYMNGMIRAWSML